jgi:hypothetical protein
MNPDTLDRSLRAADPTTGDEPVPATGVVIAHARRRLDGRFVHLAPSATSRRGPATAWVAAAVVAAALVAGGIVTWQATHSAPRAGGSAAGVTADELVVPFTLKPRSGYTLVEVQATSTGQWFMLAGRAGTATLDISGAPPAPVKDGLMPAGTTTVAGAPARLLVHPAATPASLMRGHFDETMHGLSWPLADGRWAVLVGNRPDERSLRPRSLVALAQKIDFTKSTVLRSPVAISAAPAGTYLSSYDGSYRSPDEPNRSRWFTDLHYRPRGSTTDGSGVIITAGPAANLVPNTTEAGHPAQWMPAEHELCLLLDPGVRLCAVQDRDGPADKTPVMTRAELARILGTVRLTATPAKPTSWFDAAKVLPVS